MMQNLSQMGDEILPLASAAKKKPEDIGHKVTSFLFPSVLFDTTSWLRPCRSLLCFKVVL